MKDKKAKFVPDWEQLQKDHPTYVWKENGTITVHLDGLLEVEQSLRGVDFSGKLYKEDGKILLEVR